MRLLITAILIGIVCILYAEPTESAELTLRDNTLLIKTDAYEIQFENGVITQLHNKRTTETYTLPFNVDGMPTGIRGWSGLLRRNGEHVWTDAITLIAARKIAPLKAELVFQQGQNEIRLFIAVDEDTDDLLIEQTGMSDTAGVYGIQWGCGNLDVKDVDLVLPAKGGQIIDATTPIAAKGFQYPGRWEVQLAILQGEQGGFFVRSTDATFQFKTLHYERDIESFALGFETQNQAPFDTLTSAKSVVWRLNTYSGDWRVPARQYRDWMEQTFKPWRLDEMPTWVQEIGLIVIYDYLDVGILEALAEQIDPTKTLLYVTGWRKDDYDVNYPDYTAKANFGNFVKAAHRHGFRVMLHTNLVGVSTYHPLYTEFKESQFRNEWSGNLMGWKWEQTESPHRHAFINLANSTFRKILVQQLKNVWEEYEVEAFHLDVSHFVANDANGLIEGLNSGQGNVLMHRELAEAMPGVVFSGERLHEVTFLRESFAQRWTLPPDAKPHPISAFLFSPYTLPYGHLGFPNPDRELQLYQEHLDAYENWGVLPTLRIWSVEDLLPERVETQRLLSIARAWQQLGFKPDFETDWEGDTLFQYMGKDGEIATFKATDGGSTFDLPLGEVGYERVFGVTQVKTDGSLPHWHAYNETKILGLDPRKSYLLSETPRDFSQVHINALPEGVSVTESRVTENAALFRLERADDSQEIDLLSQLHLVRTGIVVNGEKLPRQNGATFRQVDTTISGVHKAAIYAHPPHQGGSGDAFGEWELSLPDSPHIRLEFDIGLWEGSENSDGVTFIVSIQGNEIFRQHYNQQRWKHISLDLTRYRRQHIALRFTTNPGPNGNTGWDWAYWGEPKIVSELSDTPIKVGCYLPTEPIRNVPDTGENKGKRQYSLETELPGQILFFFQSGAEVVSPYNLRGTDFLTGLQFEGIFRLGSVWNSGEPTIVTIGGVQKLSIFAHPPLDGQTVLQFLLSLPKAHELMFSFSMGLEDESCSDGLSFKVLLNGQQQFEHFTDTPGWADANVSLSEFAGETVLLELVTDPEENPNCDSAHWADLLITAEGVGPDGDINNDGIVNILDLVLVGQNLGQKPPSDPRTDVNNDGQVNILDLVLVAEHLGEKVAAAPTQIDILASNTFSAEEIIVVRRTLKELEAIPQKSQNVKVAIQFLRTWLTNANQSVTETKLLPNYPNPFNPETWIPYQLAKAADVSVKIYDVSGRLVRTISIGFKPVGYYLTRERAAYWDGRNEIGESVSSGVYFLQFIAEDFSATQRIVMLK